MKKEEGKRKKAKDKENKNVPRSTISRSTIMFHWFWRAGHLPKNIDLD